MHIAGESRRAAVGLTLIVALVASISLFVVTPKAEAVGLHIVGANVSILGFFIEYDSITHGTELIDDGHAYLLLLLIFFGFTPLDLLFHVDLFTHDSHITILNVEVFLHPDCFVTFDADLGGLLLHHNGGTSTEYLGTFTKAQAQTIVYDPGCPQDIIDLVLHTYLQGAATVTLDIQML